MSSTIIIGFLDRTRVCIQAEFTAPLADDERRELLIHAAMLTGRAFAALSYERQRALAGVVREWAAARFETCPLQIVAGDPMACPHRFASTFLAPVREYALATTGCNQDAGGIDYFLPMAAAAYLKHMTVTDREPEELLKPALALCAAVAIHPITVANHFQMSAASLPKFEPVVDRTEPADPGGAARLAKRESRRRLLETRRSLLLSACMAALVIVLAVQVLSTRAPKAGRDAAAVPSLAPPQAAPPAPQPPPAPQAPLAPPASPAAPSEEPPPLQALRVPPPVPKPLSSEARDYLRKVRDLAENSLAQVEVMLVAADRAGSASEDSADRLEYGIRQLRDWRRQFTALAPPPDLEKQHRDVELALTELGGIAHLMRSAKSKPASGAIRNRLSAMHEELARTLNEAEVF